MLKKLTLFFVLLLSTVCVFAQDIPDKDIPPRPNTLVNDYANVLSADNRQMLERKLDDYNDS
ncbi:MAG: TPM domain-containing protein, partial [Mucilaginibacter sp.]